MNVKHRRAIYWMLVGAMAAVLALPALMWAQDQEPESSSKPADTPAPDSKNSKDSKQKPKTNADNATQNAPDQPMYDPLRAEKDIEVGQFYMRKGDVDAAIDRFQDATTAKPGYAIPFRYLGEAQEKKGLKKPAIKSYERYLELYPHAEDGDKIRKKIEKLRAELEKKSKG